MAPRANWKGYLKLPLVSWAVTLFPAATTRDRVRFNIINRQTGNRVHHGVVDADTGQEVPQDRYETALKQLITAKQAGDKPPTSPAPRAGNVVSLMDALRRSVQFERSAPKPKKLKRAG